jgi:hypothetical protein
MVTDEVVRRGFSGMDQPWALASNPSACVAFSVCRVLCLPTTSLLGKEQRLREVK